MAVKSDSAIAYVTDHRVQQARTHMGTVYSMNATVAKNKMTKKNEWNEQIKKKR